MEVLLITHGRMAEGVLDSISMIAGKQEHIQTMMIQMETSLEAVREQLCKKRAACQNEVMVIVSDLAGGSTTQSALKMLNEFPLTYLICGMNLALILELLFLPLDKNDEENRDMLASLVEQNKTMISLVSSIEKEEIAFDSEEL